jgi:hypothetical protein
MIEAPSRRTGRFEQGRSTVFPENPPLDRSKVECTVFSLFRRLRRRSLRKRPFPDHWHRLLEERCPFYGRLADAERERFRDHLKVFVLEKHFIGAKGLEITDDVRVTIAAAAVRLVQHLDLSYYDRLTEIVVYPFDYRHEGREGAVLGEAHTWGTVVLSWPAVLRGLSDPKDGHDTATHEFAHVLDVADGAFDGTPELRAREDYRPWAEVMTSHYLALQKRRKRRPILRAYGATNEAEFFAVATEAFFEKPDRMKREKPELYEELARFYGWDPAS